MVTLEEAKAHLHVLHDDDDATITLMIEAAVDHLRSIDVDVTADPPPPALRQAVLIFVSHLFNDLMAVLEPTAEMRRPPIAFLRLVAPYRRGCM